MLASADALHSHRAASNGKDAFIRMLYSPPALKVEGKHEKTRVK